MPRKKIPGQPASLPSRVSRPVAGTIDDSTPKNPTGSDADCSPGDVSAGGLRRIVSQIVTTPLARICWLWRRLFPDTPLTLVSLKGYLCEDHRLESVDVDRLTLAEITTRLRSDVARREKESSSANSHAYVTFAKLVEHFGIKCDRQSAFRKCLDRWRANGGKGWKEDGNPEGRDGKYLFSPSAVSDIAKRYATDIVQGESTKRKSK